MPTLTTNQKIAIALSVPVAGVLFYFLLKWTWENDEFIEGDATNNADEFVSTSDLVSELQIPKCHVGAVIGRGGIVIKQLQKESQTRINFKDDNEESGDELTDEEQPKIRTMVIRGSRERIKQAEVLIKKIIEEQPVMQKISVEIPQRVIGRIIGKGGKTIRQLCKISGAKLKIDSDNETTDIRRCNIVGTQTQIECAKQLIDEKIAEDNEFRARRRSTQEAKDKLTFAHLPAHGDFFGVYVSAMDTPGHFWVQNLTEDSKLLDNLVEQMTQFYGDRGQGSSLIPPKVGDLCCAAFQHDESWYRGEIVQVREDTNEVQIHYLDFGDTGIVSMENVKEIRKEFCDLPFHAVEVYLANIRPKGDKWSQEACDSFEKLSCCAKWNVLMARVVHYDDNGVPCIELIDTNAEKDVNIEKELVDQGFAVYKEKIPNPDTEDNSKASNSFFQTSNPVDDQKIAREKEITWQQTNDQFRTPAFEDASCGMDESERLELFSPLRPSNDGTSRVNDKDIVHEPTIAPVEQQVVSCANISELESLLGMLHVDGPETDSAETDGIFDNLIEESDLNQKDFENIPKRTEESSDISVADHYNSENLSEERDLEIEETLSSSEKIQEKHDGQENLEKDETVSEIAVTSSMNLQPDFIEAITISNVQFTDTTPEEDLGYATSGTLKDDDSEKSPQENLLNLSFTTDRPIIPQYQLNHQLQSNPKSTSTPNQYEYVGRLDTVPNRGDHKLQHNDSGPDQADYTLRRSCSEDLTNDDTLTDRSLSKSSSEITVSPHEDEECSKVDNKTPLASRSLGSITSAPPKGKRVLAANFGHIASNNKHESDDDSDADSLYLSAKEDSDSTGFHSAIGSRSNLRLNDTDSDATPSGYLSEPEDSFVGTIGTVDVDDQAKLDTTLLVEKLEQYADK